MSVFLGIGGMAHGVVEAVETVSAYQVKFAIHVGQMSTGNRKLSILNLFKKRSGGSIRFDGINKSTNRNGGYIIVSFVIGSAR